MGGTVLVCVLASEKFDERSSAAMVKQDSIQDSTSSLEPDSTDTRTGYSLVLSVPESPLPACLSTTAMLVLKRWKGIVRH